MSKPPELLSKANGFHIVRGDKIPGGLKQLALEAWLTEQPQKHFIYCGTVFGYGAPALAYAAQSCDRQATIFLSQSKFTPDWLSKIKDISKVIIQPPSSLEMLNNEAKHYKKEFDSNAHILNPGSYGAGFDEALIRVCKALLSENSFERMWVPVVSGAFLKAVKASFPQSNVIPVYCARNPDYISNAATLSFNAREKYHQPAQNLPPFPSHPHVDAKMWAYIKQHGQKGDLIWNIAK